MPDLDKVARLGCCVCREMHRVYSPACVHHLIGIKYRSTGKKASDHHVLPLCHAHHQGSYGIHTMGLRAWEKAFGTQEYYLEQTRELLESLH